MESEDQRTIANDGWRGIAFSAFAGITSQEVPLLPAATAIKVGNMSRLALKSVNAGRFAAALYHSLLQRQAAANSQGSGSPICAFFTWTGLAENRTIYALKTVSMGKN